MTKEYPPLLVLRHGETEWNLCGRLHGRFDSPLTDRGTCQAQAQRAILSGLDLEGYQAFSSPQGRAFHTAAIALAGLLPEIATDARLAEIGIGDWAGVFLNDLDLPVRDPAALYEAAPGGEGFAALRARSRDFLASLRCPTVIVSHGITTWMLRSLALYDEPQRFPAKPDLQGVVYRIENGRQAVLGISA